MPMSRTSPTIVEIKYTVAGYCKTYLEGSAYRRPHCKHMIVRSGGVGGEFNAFSKTDAIRGLKDIAKRVGWSARGKTWLCPACAAAARLEGAVAGEPTRRR